MFLLEYLRVALQLPDNSSDSVPYLNLLVTFTSSPVVMQAASVPVVSQICVYVATIFLPVSSFPASVKKAPCTSALLLRKTPFLRVLVFSLASSKDPF